jgi:hypothetical protein
MNLKPAICPRKARKTRNSIASTIHALSDGVHHGISLNIFVFFVPFVDKMVFQR